MKQEGQAEGQEVGGKRRKRSAGIRAKACVCVIVSSS